MFTANILPGQGFMNMEVYEESGGLTASGRAVEGGYKPAGKTFLGLVTNASQKEIDQWKQNGHPITHKITQYGAENPAKATDYISAANGVDYYVQGRKNPGELNVTMIYYVEERLDLKKVE